MNWVNRKIMIVSIVVVIVIVSIAAGVRYMYLRNNSRNDGTQMPVMPIHSSNVADQGAGLYFSDKTNESLVQEQQMMPRPDSPAEFARVIIERLIKGSQSGLGRIVPAETVLKAVYLTKDGTVYLDFSKEIGEKQPGGVWEEYMTVMSITHSLALNIQDVKRVKFLIEGKDVQTLSGHVDLSEPFVPGNLMVNSVHP